jgi:multidrug resistance efflux pump
MENKQNSAMKSMMTSRRGRLVIAVIIILVVIGIAVAGKFWYQNRKYVTTDNARISAPLIPVSPLATCQIISLDVEFGGYVEKGQKIATVGQPRSSNPADKQGLREIPLGRAIIESPVSGYVAAIWSYPGAIVAAGQPVITLYDTSEVWVMANVEETKVYRIIPGQGVEIKVDMLGGAKLRGKVEGIATATAGSFSLLPQNNTTANFTKVAQVVPVKISVDNPAGYLLVPGTSVEVKIVTR